MLDNKENLSNEKIKKIWQKIGTSKRSGIICPLFSIYSDDSVGIGEFRDLKLLIDWCISVGNTILQLLPMNDTGFDNSPYSAMSSFALEEAYISLDNIVGSTINIFADIKILKEKYPTSTKRVNYNIKYEKRNILKKIFNNRPILNFVDYENFKKENNFWLDDYAIFKAIKDESNNENWQNWDNCYKNRIELNLLQFINENHKKIEFYKWLQWQLFLQFSDILKYAREKGVYLMGDIPFLVSRDSADVWGNYRNCFNLSVYTGAPPDAYNAFGQKWGMPSYNWEYLKLNNYDYFKKKLKYAQNFYDMYRIDHVVGTFRLWTIDINEPEENVALNGQFDPKDENLWQENGLHILEAFINASTMLPTAEDLGVVPNEVPQILENLGILGIEVQRWNKNRNRNSHNYTFKSAREFKEISTAISSNHDMSNTGFMWKFEYGTIDETSFYKICKDINIENMEYLKNKLFDIKNSKYGRLRWKKEITSIKILLNILGKTYNEIWKLVNEYKETFNEQYSFYVTFLTDKNEYQVDLDKYIYGLDIKEIVADIISFIAKSNSIFFINSILDAFIMEFDFSDDDLFDFRINTPGTVNDKNWSIRLPINLEKLKNMQINSKLLEINKINNRF
ncbi:MAG: 4-alpha-glucanotransferase [Elusimicrobiota bacterium]|jgi:4-alpha-glucanotransferase|nr:4-alpha-glucanotransferase [Elusimicrobiota bacterium]